MTGLTTGASIWVAGALGIASGIGYIDFAVLLTMIVVVIVFVIGRVESLVMKKAEEISGAERPEKGHDEPE